MGQSAAVGEEDSAIAEAQPDPELLQAENIVRISGLTGLSEQARNIAQQVLNEQAAPIGQQFDVVDRLASQWAPTVLQQNLISVLTAKLNKTQRMVKVQGKDRQRPTKTKVSSMSEKM